MGILEQWKLTPTELGEIVSANPSMRGLIFGYVAEYKLRKIWFSDDRVSNLKKYDDHDRTRKGDISFLYKGAEFSVEVKSLQTNSVRQVGNEYLGRFQCDASDKRQVTLPNGEKIMTTCLLVGEFDLLAVNVFAFEKEWRFVFAKNRDLPRSTYKGYSSAIQNSLLASTMEVTLPPKPPFFDDPFPLLDEILQDKLSLN